MSQPEDDVLSDTEELIIAFLEANANEDGMLDKIALGTGKSRATVLKYLGSLHAKGILEYRILGRNKLWKVRQPPAPVHHLSDREMQNGTAALAARAFEMHTTLVRKAELETLLDTPEIVIFTILDDSTIVFRNTSAEHLFPPAAQFRDLVCPEGAAQMLARLSGAEPGTPVTHDLDLREKSGIVRRYHLTIVRPGPGEPQGCLAVIGEDLASRRHSKRDLSTLLYIIRAAGTTRTETELLTVAMNGIRQNLVPFSAAAVILGGMRAAYSTWEITDTDIQELAPLVTRCRDSLTAIAAAHDDPLFPQGLLRAGGTPAAGSVAIPILEGEQAAGAIILFSEEKIPAGSLGSIEIVADEIASILKLQHLEREKNEYINTLLALNRLSGILNEERDEDTLLSRSIESVMDTLGFEMGCVYLKDERDDLIPRAQKNMPENIKKMCASGAFSDLFGRAFSEKTVQYLTPEAPDYAGLDTAVKKTRIHTMLIIPIRIGESVEGLLNMGSRMERQYLPASLENIASLGLQLGTALERSRLARALEKQKK